MQREETTHRHDTRIPGSISVFTAFGVPVRFHFTFILLLIFLAVVGLQGKQSAVSDVIFVLALFASVVLHELGHAVVARHFGVRTKEIVMFPIGGVAMLEKNPPARKELWIASAGPLVNLIIGGVILLLIVAFRGTGIRDRKSTRLNSSHIP